MLRKIPLIVILGSTGTGKTKLSIELAERFGGEIISADSMQVYSNLDIVTAKATKEEQNRVPHHLLDVAKPSQPFTVVHYRNATLPLVNKLLHQNKIPIIVGGTNYYIESIVWDILVSNSPPTINITKGVENLMCGSDSDSSMISNNVDIFDMGKCSVSDLYEELKKVDAASANRIHPNNKRKIIRALEVFKSSGVPLGEILNQQRNQPGGNRLGGPLRYQHTIFFWLKCSQDILNDRLNKRVDSMLEQGLLKEIRNFYDEYLTKGDNLFTQGILQSIGFKEFIPYLEKYNKDQDEIIQDFLESISFQLPEDLANTSTPQGLDTLKNCLDELKLVTQRYSKKQIKWIKNRFLGSKDRQVPPLYALDTSNVQQWNENVFEPSVNVIESYFNEEEAKILPQNQIQHPHRDFKEEVNNFCETCERYFIGEYQWELHLKSNKHKKRKEGIKRKLKLNKGNLFLTC